MQIDIIRNKQELRQCVDMYFSWPINYPMDYSTCLKNIEYYWLRKKFLRIIRKDREVLAWILCDLARPLHSNILFLSQQYYCSNLQGYNASKALILLHNEMLEEASRKNIPYCLSNCRFDDNTFRLSRILEKTGWSRMGYQAVAHVPTLLRERETSRDGQSGSWWSLGRGVLGKVSARTRVP